MKRRTFIFCLAGTAAAGLTGLRLAGSGTPSRMVKVTRRGFALGTQVSLTVFHPNEKEAHNALDAAFAELDKVEDIMSLYRPGSQISQLNNSGKLVDPHPYLVEVLEESQALSRATNGAFDITIQPLWKLHFEHSRKGTKASSKEIGEALALVDYRRLKVSQESIELGSRGQEVSLNGIAQGYAADRVAAVLEAHGVESALIDTGEFGAIGAHAEKDSWSVGIKHPRQQDALMGVAPLKGKCLATSGDYETRFSEDYRHHHLLDPQTGYSPEELSSVSVIADSAMQADALSTAVFLLGLENGRVMIEERPGVEAVFVTKDGREIRTDGFPSIS
ncbi:MAG: FAD:protein FMN transferase [Puniceicoccaceae bacterium]